MNSCTTLREFLNLAKRKGHVAYKVPPKLDGTERGFLVFPSGAARKFFVELN
jgi:hypothetical protein